MMGQPFESKPPDWTVSAMDKENAQIKGNIGVAWNQPDGTIRIKLNPFVMLDTTKHQLVITLFRKDTFNAPPSKKSKGSVNAGSADSSGISPPY